MKYKEALETIKYEVDEECHCGYIENELRLAMTALEKQIPKKVVSQFESHAIYDNGEYIDQLDIATFKCPICGCVLACGEIDMSDCSNCLYCDKCGQKLDWK